MGGLIPLLLPSTTGRRSSVIFNPVHNNPTEYTRPSTATAPVTTSVFKTTHRRQQSLPAPKPTGRLFMTPAVLPILPYTPAEWKSAIIEVKRKYVSRKYRTCSARCCEILDHLKDKSNVEVLYLVYLHFYAASSFEICAQPLSQSSYRNKLLLDARDHYEQAAALILKAEETTRKSRSVSSSSSVSSSLHSPSTSISSQASTRSTVLSSPRASILGLDMAKPETAIPMRTKKRVFFSSPPEPIEIPKPWQNWSEPYVRPDSPTLGWEEDHFLFGGSHEDKHKCAPLRAEPVVIIESEPETPKSFHHTQPSPSLPSIEEESFDLESFLETDSKNKFAAQLSELRSQVSWHRDAIDMLLSQPDDPTPDTPAIPDLPPLPYVSMPAIPPPCSSLTRNHSSSPTVTLEPDSPATSSSAPLPSSTFEHALSCILEESFGGVASFDLGLYPGSDAWGGSRARSRDGSFSSSTRPVSVASTMRVSGGGDDALRHRIERMRANGWQRKRFDNRRYEALRETVLTELGA